MKHYNSASKIVGFFVILFGIGILCDNLGIFNFTGMIWKLWPLILIYFAFKKLLCGHFLLGIALFVLGLALLLGNFNLLGINVFVLIWPALIILAGIKILLTAFNPKIISSSVDEDIHSEGSSQTNSKNINEFAIFASNKKQYTSNDFKGGSVATIFGETKLDLSKCQITSKGANLEIVSIFGNTQIFAPEDMNIYTTMVPVLGTTEDQRSSVKTNKESGVLHINAVAIFGGVQLKNPKQ